MKYVHNWRDFTGIKVEHCRVNDLYCTERCITEALPRIRLSSRKGQKRIWGGSSRQQQAASVVERQELQVMAVNEKCLQVVMMVGMRDCFDLSRCPPLHLQLEE